MRRYGLDQLTTEERQWLALQSSLLRDGVAGDADSGVFERRRAGGLASVVFFSLVIGAGALALTGWSLLQLNRFAHSLGPVMLVVLGAAVAVGLIALYWRGAVTLAVARLPYLPMWIVTTEHLIRVSGTGVTVWPLRDLAQVDLRKSKGGVSLVGTYDDGRRFHVSFGLAMCGGLTWPDGSSIARAIQTAGGTPAADAVSGLFGSPPQSRGARGPGSFRSRALAAGAVVLVCIGGSFAYHFSRASEARALMVSGALASPYEENGRAVEPRPASTTKAVSEKPSGEPTRPGAESEARPRGKTASVALRSTHPRPTKRRRKARASRAGRRRTRPSIRPTGGRLPRQVISRVVSRKRNAISACYRKGLASNPGLKGRVLVKLVIGSSGAVTSARDAGSSLPDRRVVSCVIGQMRALRFPAPQGGSATVVYPLVLSP